MYFLLYEMMYNDNENKYFLIHESIFLIIRDDIFDNDHYRYIREYITITNILIIHENVFLII